MSTYFHVDMAGRLEPGMRIDLSPAKPSTFGLNYWRRFRNVGIRSIPSLQHIPSTANLLDEAAYREFYLEVVRTDHPEISTLPTVSRLNVFFAVGSLKDAERYIERKQFRGRARIYEVHSQGSPMKLDMNWLDHKFPRDITLFGYYYIAYWRGLEMQNDPDIPGRPDRSTLWEVLLSSPVTIGSVVSEART